MNLEQETEIVFNRDISGLMFVRELVTTPTQNPGQALPIDSGHLDTEPVAFAVTTGETRRVWYLLRPQCDYLDGTGWPLLHDYVRCPRSRIVDPKTIKLGQETLDARVGGKSAPAVIDRENKFAAKARAYWVNWRVRFPTPYREFPEAVFEPQPVMMAPPPAKKWWQKLFRGKTQ